MTQNNKENFQNTWRPKKLLKTKERNEDFGKILLSHNSCWFSINKDGAQIFDLCDGTKTLQEMALIIAKNAVDTTADDVLPKVKDFLIILKQLSFIE